MMSDRPAPEPGSAVKRRFSLSAILTGALMTAAVALSIGLTASAYTDRASLNLGPTGIGVNSPFDIAAVLPNGTLAQAVPGSGVSIPVTGEQAFVPGRSVTVVLSVANNTPDLAATATVAVTPSDAAGTGQVGSAPNITSFVRVTIFDTTTLQLLVGGSTTDATQGVPVSAASASVGRLNPRGSAALADGATWVPGAAGSWRSLTVVLYYVDTPATSSYNGGQTALAVKFDATSTP